MDKQELKNLKKAYKNAVVLELAEAADLERRLADELGEEWEFFLIEVTAYAEGVRNFGEEAYRRVLSASGVGITQPEVDALLAEAKNMGPGALPCVQKAIERGKAEWRKNKADRDDAVRKLAAKERLEIAKSKQVLPGGEYLLEKKLMTTAETAPAFHRTPDQVAAKQENHERSKVARRSHKVQIKGVAYSRGTVPELPAVEVRSADSSVLRAFSTHPNDVTTLKPSAAWTVCLDESYVGDESEFVGEGGGVIAGVVFPDDDPLPRIEQLHIAEDYEEQRLRAADRAVETILHHPNCGVLAMSAAAQPMALGWEDMMSSWVDVLLRLLPFPDDAAKVKVSVLIEPRGPYQNGSDFLPLDLACMKTVKESFPDLARRLDLQFGPLPKRQAGGKSWNPYPDIVGHTCLTHGWDNTARQRYRMSAWGGVCYLNVQPRMVAAALRYLYRREPLDEESWQFLMAHAEHGLGRGIAESFGRRVKTSPEEWNVYLGYLNRYLKSGAVSMRMLRQAVEWLERYRPADGIPKKAELVWLTGKLALSNHEGKLLGGPESPFRQKFDALCGGLYEENAPLVCEAVLNLAVAYTNAYEFESALGMLQSFLSKDRALVGISAYGKLLSSQGQHFAFCGMADEAIGSFGKALECFARLSDERERNVNLGITRAYLATVTMDHRPENALRALSLYLLGSEDADVADLESRIRELACNRPNDKFSHHVAIRYAASAEREDPLRRAYRAERDRWCEPAVGHPWELIEFYRALLSASDLECERHLESAYRLALQEGGETVMVIAAVIAGTALVRSREEKWRDRFSRALEVAGSIPGLKEGGRYQALVDQPAAKLGGLELAAKVLPFNFR